MKLRFQNRESIFPGTQPLCKEQVCVWGTHFRNRILWTHPIECPLHTRRLHFRITHFIERDSFPSFSLGSNVSYLLKVWLEEVAAGHAFLLLLLLAYCFICDYCWLALLESNPFCSTRIWISWMPGPVLSTFKYPQCPETYLAKKLICQSFGGWRWVTGYRV